MTSTLQLLTDQNETLLREAYAWSETAPRWFKESFNAYKETEEEFIENSKNEMLFGVFLDEILTAVIRLIPAKNNIYELHLMAKRKTDLILLIEAGTSLRDYLFSKGVDGFYGWIPSANRGVCKLYEALGFTESGITRYKGVMRDRLIEWKQMVRY